MSLLKKFPFLEPFSVAVESVAGEPPIKGLEVVLGDDVSLSEGFRAIASLSEGKYPWGAESIDKSLSSSVVFFVVAASAGGSVAARLMELLSKSISDEVGRLDARSLVEVLNYSGVKVERGNIAMPWLESSGGVIPLLLQWRVHISKFLPVSAGAEDPVLSLANQFLLSGWVYLDVSRLRALAVRALALAARRRLMEAEELLSEWRPPPQLERLTRLVRLKLGSERLPYEAEALPPCIARIMGRLEAGSNLRDEEVYTLLVFLARLEMPDSEEERIASMLGLTRDQLRRALTAAAGYPVPSCRSLSQAGICKCRGSLLESYKQRLEEVLLTLTGLR